jgi:hypothetical protein
MPLPCERSGEACPKMPVLLPRPVPFPPVSSRRRYERDLRFDLNQPNASTQVSMQTLLDRPVICKVPLAEEGSKYAIHFFPNAFDG